MENAPLVATEKESNQLNLVSIPPPVVPTMKPGEPSLSAKLLSAGLAACFADMITFPLDTAKVRLQVPRAHTRWRHWWKAGFGRGDQTDVHYQRPCTDEEPQKKILGVPRCAIMWHLSSFLIQGEGRNPTTGSAGHHIVSKTAENSAAQPMKYRGVIGTVCTISRQEGPRALYNGLIPGLQRQMCFASVRIGLYDTVKQFYVDLFNVQGHVGIPLRIMAGITTGGMAVLCAQPTDVVKVRFQCQAAGVPKRYNGVFAAYRAIAVEEGVRGLWKGTSPNVARNAIVNAAELVSYDIIKQKILALGILSDNMPCHFVSAFGAGFCTTVVASPVDVVKTRFMNSGAGTYSGVFDCARSMFKGEGYRAFYKGFMPSFMRLASWNTVMFVCYEQLKRAFTESPKLPSIEIERSSNKRYI